LSYWTKWNISKS